MKGIPFFKIIFPLPSPFAVGLRKDTRNSTYSLLPDADGSLRTASKTIGSQALYDLTHFFDAGPTASPLDAETVRRAATEAEVYTALFYEIKRPAPQKKASLHPTFED
jgi:hypothetical protein